MIINEITKNELEKKETDLLLQEINENWLIIDKINKQIKENDKRIKKNGERIDELIKRSREQLGCNKKPETKAKPTLRVFNGGLYKSSVAKVYVADDLLSDEFKAWQRKQRTIDGEKK